MGGSGAKGRGSRKAKQEAAKLRAALGSRLIEASGFGAAGEVEALLAAGADLSWADGRGWTAAHAAAARGRVDALKVLLAAGADPMARDRWEMSL